MVYAQVYHSFSGEPFPDGGCPILNTAVEADDTHVLLKERAAKAVSDWKKSITKMIDEGRKAGEFNSDADSTQVALSIIALIDGGMMIAKVTDDHGNMDMILKTVEMLILQLKA